MTSSLLKMSNQLGGPLWIGGRHYAVLVDGGPDRVFGQYLHTGRGKWNVTVHVSYWRAWHLIRNGHGRFAGWGRFPRCCIELHQANDTHVAREYVEVFSGVRMRTPEELGI